MKCTYILLFCLTLSSCSTLGVAANVAKSMLGEQPTLSVDAQVGDRKMNVGQNSNHVIRSDNNKGILTVASDSSRDSKKFQHADTVNIQEGPNWFLIVLLVLGWILPTPLSMYRGLIDYITNKDK